MKGGLDTTFYFTIDFFKINVKIYESHSTGLNFFGNVARGVTSSDFRNEMKKIVSRSGGMTVMYFGF
jgi:hypothetical protein